MRTSPRDIPPNFANQRSRDAAPPHPRRCVLVGDSVGENRLVVAVAHRLVEQGADVTIIAGRDEDAAQRVRQAAVRSVRDPSGLDTLQRIIEHASSRLVAIPLADPRDLESVLETTLKADVDCLLGLSKNGEQNLSTALIAHRTDKKPPVVLRAFDPELAEDLESQETGLGVRRAYSVAHLSAPAYVAAAVFGEVRDHLVTMRVGVEYVSICRVRVPESEEADRFPAPRRRRTSGLVGRTPEQIADEGGCQILGRMTDEGWVPAEELRGTALQAGDDVLVGGPLTAVLGVARSRCVSRRPAQACGHASDRAARCKHLFGRLAAWSKLSASYVTPLLIALVAAFTGAALAAFAATSPHQVVDLFYGWANMAVGSADNTPSGLPKVMGAAGVLAGGLALGLVTSFMSAQQIQRHVVERMRRRAARMSGHVIVVGTDDVGLRVATLLCHLEIRAVIVEPNRERHGELGTLQGCTALQEVAEHTPILTGNLRDTLEQARVDRARAVIASSESSLLNVEACMRAKRRRGRDEIRTVARIFDDSATSDAAKGLGIDQWVAAVDEAAPAFVDAALEGGSARIIAADGVDLYGALWSGPVHAAKMHRWRAAGIRVLAVASGGELQRLTAPPAQLRRGDQAILVGPRDAVRRAIGHDDASPAEVWDIFGGRASGSAQ